MMNTEELKRRALVLEEELKAVSKQSTDVAAFAAYEPLINAINRAKACEITSPEDLPGMRYWMFETDIPAFSSLELAIARFRLMLNGTQI
jgi:hypothetical protein